MGEIGKFDFDFTNDNFDQIKKSILQEDLNIDNFLSTSMIEEDNPNNKVDEFLLELVILKEENERLKNKVEILQNKNASNKYLFYFLTNNYFIYIY